MSALEDVLDPIPEGHGPIGLLSGDEYTPDVEEFDRAVLELSGPRVALVLCADHRNSRANARRACDHFARLGADAFVLDFTHDTPARAREIPEFDLLYIGGGSPSELLACLRASAVWEEILARWARGAALAGASAGAMALSVHCQIPRPGDDMPTQWSRGLGPLKRVAIAAHASSRRAAWLRASAATAPAPLLCIGDKTGVIDCAFAKPQVVGSSEVWVLDHGAI